MANIGLFKKTSLDSEFSVRQFNFHSLLSFNATKTQKHNNMTYLSSQKSSHLVFFSWLNIPGLRIWKEIILPGGKLCVALT